MSVADDARSAHWKRQAVLFLGGQAASLLGSGVVQFALVWYITLSTGSGRMITIATLVALVPMVLLMPFGGVLADRYSRRLLIAGGDLLVAASTAVLLVAFLLGHGHYWLIFTVMAIRSVGAGLQGPAVGALLPQIVPATHLGRVNGYNASIQAAVNLSSPLLAGVILSIAPIAWVLVIDLITAAIGVSILLVWITTPAHAGAAVARERHPLHDLRDGFVFIYQHRFLRRLIGYFAIVNFLTTPVSLLTTLQVSRTFSDEYWRLAVVEVCLASGMLFGGVLVGWWGRRTSRVVTFAVAGLILALLTIALGLPINFVIYNVWVFLAGIALPFYQSPAITMLQLSVPEAMMGRLFSLVAMIGAGVMPFGMLIFGPMVDRISVEHLLVVTGVLFAITTVFVLRDRVLAAGEPVEPDCA